MSEAVVRAVSSEKGVDSRGLEPLSSVVELGALNGLFAPQLNGSRRRTDGRVEFTFDGCTVRVTPDIEAKVTEPIRE